MNPATENFLRTKISEAVQQGVPTEQIVSGYFFEKSPSVEQLVRRLILRGFSLSANEYVSYVDELLQDSIPMGEVSGIDDGISMSRPSANGNAWRNYKKQLQDAGFSPESISDIELSAAWVIDHLDTGDGKCKGPRKGLVMGSVQSGKTAHMGALMSMAADAGINIVIVLSGVLNSLRNQTMKRFITDLNNTSTTHWKLCDFNEVGANFIDFKLGECSPTRYLIVCLKNSKRLLYLNKKLEESITLKQHMRILVIDDEADQAGPNTAKMDFDLPPEEQERTAINRCLVNLADNTLRPGNLKSPHEFGAMNFISYTATPYANVLNEDNGLYPSSFVTTLKEPREYFGAHVIFGTGEEGDDGLNVVRTIPSDEQENVTKRHHVTYDSELFAAVAWFFCVAAELRTRKQKWGAPISMLIHTSMRVGAHDWLDEALSRWFDEIGDAAFVGLCRDVYDREIKKFTKQDLKRDFHGGYPEKNLCSVIDAFPPFDSLVEEILLLLHERGRIMLNSSDEIIYRRGVHLCVDNSCVSDTETEHMRIAYPSKAQLRRMEKAPAFIVIGGSTLSRGLTLEGLTCSYFARNVEQADSLMQMARWFGYRFGYELSQRIWMTADNVTKFVEMTKVDIALKQELKHFSDNSISPAEYGPRVMCFPGTVRLNLTSRNKMQGAQVASKNYSGFGFETTRFSSRSVVHQRNGKAMVSFLESLGSGRSSEIGTTGLVWDNVPSSKALQFLTLCYSFQETADVEERNDFLKWMQEQNKRGNYASWAVALCTPRKGADGDIEYSGQPIKTLQRSMLKSSPEGEIDIGSLRSGIDALIDIDCNKLSEEQKTVFDNALKGRTGLAQVRSDLGMADRPIMLLYLIDGHGRSRPRSEALRLPIKIGCDVPGMSVVVPGLSWGRGHADSVSVRISRR